MKDTIRELYYWQVPDNPIKRDTEEYKEAVKELDKYYEKIKFALKEVYGDQASNIENEWYGALASVESEDDIIIFKEGLYLGFDIARALLERDK